MLRRTAMTVPVLSAALAIPSAADAAVFTHRDATGDLQTNPGNETIHRLPRQRDGDITRTTVDHTRRQIVVTTHYRALVRDGHDKVYVALRVPSGREYDVTHYLVGNSTELDLRGSTDGALSCPGLRSSVSWARAVTQVRVPRSCVERPAWVNAQVEFRWEKAGFDIYTWDNAFRRFGVPGAGFSGRVRAG